MGDASDHSKSTSLLPSSHKLARGTYAPSGLNDKRGPCPLVNALANHGYINRDGRDVPVSQLNAAMNEVGLSKALGAVFARSIYNEREDPGTVSQKPSLLARLWALIRDPWTIMAVFAMRRPNQLDTRGRKILDLDQLALHGVVEHDISLCRRDYYQKEGNLVLQQDLVKDLLASSSDGKTLTMEDLVALRKRRIQRQRDENPALKYGSMEHQIGCTEIALVLDVLGDGHSIPCSYAKAFFQEERLPMKEGWRKRWLWTLGFLELASTAGKVKTLIGLKL